MSFDEKAYAKEYRKRPGVLQKHREETRHRRAKETPEQYEKRMKQLAEYRARPEVKERMRRYYQEHKAKSLEHTKAYRRRNPMFYKSEANVERKKRWKEANRAKLREKQRRRTALKRATAAKHEDLAEIYKKLLATAERCGWCGCDLKDKSVHVDHIIPLSKGGAHQASNLLVTCASCNLKKHNLMPEQFVQKLRRQNACTAERL